MCFVLFSRQGATWPAGRHLPAAARQQGDVWGGVRGRHRGAAQTLLHLTLFLTGIHLPTVHYTQGLLSIVSINIVHADIHTLDNFQDVPSTTHHHVSYFFLCFVCLFLFRPPVIQISEPEQVITSCPFFVNKDPKGIEDCKNVTGAKNTPRKLLSSQRANKRKKKKYLFTTWFFFSSCVFLKAQYMTGIVKLLLY